MHRRRVFGRFVSHPSCAIPGPNNRSLVVSNINPCDALTRRSILNSSLVNTPAFTCGNNPVSRNTASHAFAAYSAVLAHPNSLNPSRASSRVASGRSPNVNKHSVAPAAAPRRATSTISSSVMYTRFPAALGS
jgi:hypothetical protein